MHTYLRWLVGALALAMLLSGCGDKLAGSRQSAGTSTPMAVLAAVDREPPSTTSGAAEPIATEEPAAEPSPTFVPTAKPAATPEPSPTEPSPTATTEPPTPTSTPEELGDTAGGSSVTPEDVLAQLGPEWRLAGSGDTNHDGILDIIAYVPTEARPREGALKSDPEYTLFIQRAAIVQLDPQHRPELLVEVSSRELRTADAILVPYSTYDRMPAFYALRARADDTTPLAVIGVEQNGEIYGQGAGVYWDAGLGRYGRAADDARRADGFPSPTPTGIDWRTYESADYNFSLAYPRCFTALQAGQLATMPAQAQPPLDDWWQGPDITRPLTALLSLRASSDPDAPCPMADLAVDVYPLDNFRWSAGATRYSWPNSNLDNWLLTEGAAEPQVYAPVRLYGDRWVAFRMTAGDGGLASRSWIVHNLQGRYAIVMRFVRKTMVVGSDDPGLEQAIVRTLRMGQ